MPKQTAVFVGHDYQDLHYGQTVDVVGGFVNPKRKRWDTITVRPHGQSETLVIAEAELYAPSIVKL
jgi:hypothetical protein